jgi:hypothetical protein
MQSKVGNGKWRAAARTAVVVATERESMASNEV